MTLTAASRLGPYEVLEPLGAGGMGEVYRARDPRLGRDVAIKVLPEPVAEDPERLQRFEHEARAVAALNHPNILTVHDVGSHDGSPYVVTELLEGETLREVLLRRAPSTRQVVAWGMQAAQGLAAAHQKGIVHRDIKPENLFLTIDGRVKILDFGLAKLMQPAVPSVSQTEASTAAPATDVGVILGTVAYMSPEQVTGARRVDARSDIFSLGVVLYELSRGSTRSGARRCRRRWRRSCTRRRRAVVFVSRGFRRAVDRIVGAVPREATGRAAYQSAHDLALALEDGARAAPVARPRRCEEVEERSPYPGLSSFTEKDAARFFGREEEVGALWRAAARAESPRRDRTLGRGQDVVRARGRRGRAARRMGGDRGDARDNAPLRGLGRALGA